MRVCAFSILVCIVAGLTATCSGPDTVSPSPEAREEPENGESEGQMAASAPAGPSPTRSAPLATPAPGVSTPTPGPSPVTTARTSGRTVERGSGLPGHDFDLTFLDGGSLRLSGLRGKMVVLNFWASWCPPCLESLPQLERLRNILSGRNFQILAVNVDSKPEKALRFLERNPVGYPSASDPDGLLPRKYQLQTMPTSYLIDRRGIVRHVHNGFSRHDFGELHARIKQMLEQQ